MAQTLFAMRDMLESAGFPSVGEGQLAVRRVY
jgi:hypothetical protein